ncbi:MAG: YggS family pyridoxal phosphate-dependent enzyme [Bacteroidales bacterium]|nr:YggS family pyridoxal phosphate-dependent enzyme [Bacteroidales bacterium]MBR1950473.1 YggS family pyridoxal phosphate-dependent enzyme [Bacteroidales bacterium]
MSIGTQIEILKNELPSTVKLVAVSKFNPVEAIQQAYEAGQRIFGESRPQELQQKVALLPDDIKWHFIGHLQTNKLKMVLPYVELVHSVDSERLLMEIDKFAVKNGLKVRCLLELFVAQEESKQGFSEEELMALLDSLQQNPLQGVEICGLMGMASFVEDENQIRGEFQTLKRVYDKVREKYISTLPQFNELSMGMSGDYRIAIECGSTMVRIGTTIFGARNYSK